MRCPARIGLALALAALALGCAVGAGGPPAATAPPDRAAGLQRDLAGLSATADAAEARLLAEAALRQSRSLAAEYQLIRPPLLHNLFVNVGLKRRGLCWHWTEDLLDRLGTLHLASYELHWGIAHRGKLFREHNSVIVTARGSALATGIVLDGWRESGELYWTPVREDSYPWEPY